MTTGRGKEAQRVFINLYFNLEHLERSTATGKLSRASHKRYLFHLLEKYKLFTKMCAL